MGLPRPHRLTVSKSGSWSWLVSRSSLTLTWPISICPVRGWPRRLSMGWGKPCDARAVSSPFIWVRTLDSRLRTNGISRRGSKPGQTRTLKDSRASKLSWKRWLTPFLFLFLRGSRPVKTAKLTTSPPSFHRWITSYCNAFLATRVSSLAQANGMSLQIRA